MGAALAAVISELDGISTAEKKQRAALKVFLTGKRCCRMLKRLMGMWIIAKVFLYKPTQTGNDQKKSYGITNKITTELTAEGRYWMMRRKPERFIRFHVRAKRCSNPRTDLLSCVASAT